MMSVSKRGRGRASLGRFGTTEQVALPTVIFFYRGRAAGSENCQFILEPLRINIHQQLTNVLIL